MIQRFKSRLQEKERRKFFVAFIAGKMLGLGIALLVAKYFIGFLSAKASAQDGTVTAPAEDIINATNTAWVLVTAFLVFFMQAGLMMVEAGFARTRETVNVLLDCIVDTSLCRLLFSAFRFALLVGKADGLIRHDV